MTGVVGGGSCLNFGGSQNQILKIPGVAQQKVKINEDGWVY